MGFGLGCTILFFIFSAPDVALTEAVIGAGLSGFIFLTSILQTMKKRTLEKNYEQ
jgi:multicomponent Na+:H+ antiporter subunit B